MIAGEANERRSQAQNQAVAFFRLRVNLALEVRYPCGPHMCLARSGNRGATGELKPSATHEDFPALLAEALDVLAALDADPKRAAARLNARPRSWCDC